MSKDIFEIINPTNTLGVCRPLAHILGVVKLLCIMLFYQSTDTIKRTICLMTVGFTLQSPTFLKAHRFRHLGRNAA